MDEEEDDSMTFVEYKKTHPVIESSRHSCTFTDSTKKNYAEVLYFNIPKSDPNQPIFLKELRFLNEFKSIQNIEYILERDPHRSKKNIITLTYICRSRTFCKVRAKFSMEIVDENIIIQPPTKIEEHSAGCREKQKVNVETKDYKSDIVISEILPKFLDDTLVINDAVIHKFIEESDKSLTSLEKQHVTRVIKKRAKDQRLDSMDLISLLKKRFCYGGDSSFLRKVDVYGDFELFSYPGADDLMKTASIFCIDGTFKLLKKVRQNGRQPVQLLTIMFLEPKSKVYVPGFHAILYTKSEVDYLKIFSELKGYMENATLISVDFESGLKNALVKAGFDSSIIKGCLFHYRQAIIRRFRKVFSKPTDFNFWVLNIIMVLPFMNAASFHNTIEVLSRINASTEHDSFMGYIKSYWEEKFDILTKTDHTIEIFTNNALESYHSQISRLITSLPITLEDAMKLVFDLDRERYSDAMKRGTSATPVSRQPRSDIFVPKYEESVSEINQRHPYAPLEVKSLSLTPATDYTDEEKASHKIHVDNYFKVVDYGIIEDSVINVSKDSKSKYSDNVDVHVNFFRFDDISNPEGQADHGDSLEGSDYLNPPLNFDHVYKSSDSSDEEAGKQHPDSVDPDSLLFE